MTLADDSSASPLPDAAAVMAAIEAGAGPDGLTYREILTRAQRRGFAPFILFAAVLLLLPIDIVLHQLAALTLLICGAGLATGAAAPWTPRLIGNRRLSQAGIARVAAFLRSQQSWSALAVSPRMPEFALGAGEKAVAIALIILALSVAAPLPDVIPALAALAIGLGLLQRDGLVMMIGVAATFGWAAYLATMIAGLATGAPFALGWAQEQASWLLRFAAAPAAHP